MGPIKSVVEMVLICAPEHRAMTAKTDDSGLRPGEVTVPLPAATDAGLYFVGRIRTPWTARKDCPKNTREARERGTVCSIEVDQIGRASCREKRRYGRQQRHEEGQR